MYILTKIQESGYDYLELTNSRNNSKARISLYEGGRLEELQFEGVSLIKDLPNSKYENTYASSILFPFANRIKTGMYTFQDKTYQFNCNEKGRDNAIHGLVFNKHFVLVNQNINSDFAEVTLSYEEKEKPKGFPFLYKINLTYILSEKAIGLSASIENVDDKPFPFTLGWHPYFLSNDLYISELHFESHQKIIFDENLITTGVYKNHFKSPFKIKDVQLDDCYILDGNKVAFKTPLYQIEIHTDKEENYLQLYNPKDTQIIAIEPMTGVSDSFNNKIGLQVLQPNTEYNVKWNVIFNKLITN